jgi:peptide/nickel transport system permease protein
MLRFALYRIALLVVLLFGLSILTFCYLQLIPGDPVSAMLGPAGSPELIAQMRHQFGLDQPLLTQYWNWLTGLFRGDLGISFISRQPIEPILINRIPATLQLTFGGIVFTVLIGWPVGFLAGIYKDSWIDRVCSALALVGLSTPGFWLATIFVLVLSIHHRWLPSQGYVPFSQDPWASIRDTFMPALVLGLGLAPYLARMTRAATIEVQQEQYVSHARAKGLRRHTIRWRYSARNAVLPIVVVLALQLGRLLSGQVIIEEIYAWPGVGRLLVEGAAQRDYYMVQAVVLVMAALLALLNLASELIRAWLDPRIRL